MLFYINFFKVRILVVPGLNWVNTFTTSDAEHVLNGVLKIICTHLVLLVGPYITSNSV